MAGVRDTDNGFRAFNARIASFGKPVVRIGVLDGSEQHGKRAKAKAPKRGKGRAKEKAADSDELTVLALATIHEFGLGVPERSFIRAWYDENKTRAEEALRRLLMSVIAGKRTKEQALELFGQWAQGEIQKRIASNIAPPLAASTIKAKGSSVALIDTGQLRSSISYRVE